MEDMGVFMLFIVLGEFKAKPTKESIDAINSFIKNLAKEGVVLKGMYWTLGRCDTIGIFETPDEKLAMKATMGVADITHRETLAVVPREEASKFI